MDPLVTQMDDLMITDHPVTMVEPVDPSFTLLKMGALGVIRTYCMFKGYGFIEGLLPYSSDPTNQNSTPGDVLFHQKHVQVEASKFAGLEFGKLRKVLPLKGGQTVKFDLYQKPNGQLVAFQVQGANGLDLVLDEEWILKEDRKEMARKITTLQAELKAAQLKTEKDQAKAASGSTKDCLCILCKMNPPVMMYRPCNHVSVCEPCFKSPNFSSCPSNMATVCMTCRKTGAKLEKVFLP